MLQHKSMMRSKAAASRGGGGAAAAGASALPVRHRMHHHQRRRCCCQVANAAAATPFSVQARGGAFAAAPRARGIAAAAKGSEANGGARTATVAAAGALRELTSADFYEFLEASADKLTVVDFYTDWCGPCKLILPELIKLSAELESKGGQIVKFNCNKENKELGKALGIKVAPTFHLYRGRERVADMTGAKVDALKALIEQHLP